MYNDIHMKLTKSFGQIKWTEDTACLLESKVKRTRIKAMNSKGRFPIPAKTSSRWMLVIDKASF